MVGPFPFPFRSETLPKNSLIFHFFLSPPAPGGGVGMPLGLNNATNNGDDLAGVPITSVGRPAVLLVSKKNYHNLVDK